MQTQEPGFGKTFGDLEECLRSIRYARAVDLARCQRFLEAESILAPAGQLPSQPAELDLLARISAQQRDFRKACRRWERALELSPDNNVFLEAHQAAEDHLRTQNRRLGLAGVAGAVLVFLITFVLVVTFFQGRTQRPGMEVDDFNNTNNQMRSIPASPSGSVPGETEAPRSAPGRK
jgi:tetratricopeptide (TPR) repeat protein